LHATARGLVPAPGARRAPTMNAGASQRSSGRALVAAGLLLGWILGGGAYLLYCAFTYRGLVRWVGDWEMRHLGAYAWRGTFLAGIVVLVLPVYLLVKLLPRDSSISTPLDPTSRALPGPGDARSRAARVRRAILWVGLGALLVAATSGFLGYRESNQVVVHEAFDLSRATAVAPKHVELSGMAQTGFLIVQRVILNGHTTVHLYVPLTSSGWSPTEPVVYFANPTSPVYVGDSGLRRFDPGTAPFAVRMKGSLLADALPGTVRSGFEQRGLRLAPRTWVLDTRPSADEEIYFLVAIPAGIVALLSFGLLAAVRLVRRRAPAPGSNR